jgi:UDP-glucose 4-epimerase
MNEDANQSHFTSPRAAAKEPSVVVTGICGNLGRSLMRQLHRTQRVVGIDRRPFAERPKDVVYHQIDMRRKKTRDVLRTENVQAVVHLGIMHDPRKSSSEHHDWNVAGFQKLLEGVSAYRIPKLIVLSSANAYGPRPDNPQFLTEEAPLLGGADFSDIRDLIEVDMLAQSFFWRHPETETVILRPVHILGSVRNAASNYLRLPVIPSLMGFDPMVQVVHQNDVVQAIIQALRPGVRGIFNLGGPQPAPLSRLVKHMGKKQLPLPHWLLSSAIDRMWKMHMTSFPSPELGHIRFVCMVDDARAREVLGYQPRYSLEETISAINTLIWV